jgi:DNA repair protein RecO (recombination protein O)
VRAWAPSVVRARDNGLVPGMRRPLQRDDAVVLRVQKLGESDRIITLLTRRHGRLRAVARGVRKMTSRYGARLEPFGHIDVQWAVGSGLHTISQVEGIALMGKHFVDDYPRYTAASAIVETAERLTTEEHEPSVRLFQLTLGALRALADGEHSGTLVLDAYLLRAMQHPASNGPSRSPRAARYARSAARRARPTRTPPQST